MNDVIDRFDGSFRFLSNFAASPITMRGLVYPTVEHAYQAAKTTDDLARLVIQGATSAAVAKKLGRGVTLRDDWDEVKLPLMLACVRQKFRDPELRRKLLATGSSRLVEGNHWGDTFWGVCDRVGENHLGKILMAVREEIRTAMAEEPRLVARRTFKTGVQSLWALGDRWVVGLDNATNHTRIDIPAEKAPQWQAILATGRSVA